MAWSPKAREAATLARKRKGHTLGSGPQASGAHAFTNGVGSQPMLGAVAQAYRAHGQATKDKRQARQMPGGLANYPTNNKFKKRAIARRKGK